MEENIKAILDYFGQINAIPRCSKNEARIGLWLKQWAEKKQLAVKQDSAGNLRVRVPPTAGYEKAPVIDSRPYGHGMRKIARLFP